MRGTIERLNSARPMGTMLPAVYQEDPFTMALMAGLDTVMAPIPSTLDNIDAYISPRLAPVDFLDWLGQWVGAVLDENWPIERQRAMVASSVPLYRLRGTVAGLTAHVRIFTGGSVQVAETGGVAVSQVPGGAFPGESEPRMTVRVTVPDPASVNLATIEALVAASKPAHVVHRVEVVGR
jgi:phage tail-like protein